ncbi:MAG: outer membrane protein assembly factor BamE [Caulobacterales bacterium]
MGRFAVSASAALLLMAAGAACSPTREYHGFTAEDEAAPQVQIGVDTKQTVMQRLGSPSTQSALETSTAWYYVTSVQERFAFYTPKTVERTILAIRFDANDTVQSVDRYGIDRGQIVAYNNNETPTRGRELGILEQIFGNVGQSSPLPSTDEDDRRPGRN